MGSYFLVSDKKCSVNLPMNKPCTLIAPNFRTTPFTNNTIPIIIPNDDSVNPPSVKFEYISSRILELTFNDNTDKVYLEEVKDDTSSSNTQNSFNPYTIDQFKTFLFVNSSLTIKDGVKVETSDIVNEKGIPVAISGLPSPLNQWLLMGAKLNNKDIYFKDFYSMYNSDEASNIAGFRLPYVVMRA